MYETLLYVHPLVVSCLCAAVNSAGRFWSLTIAVCILNQKYSKYPVMVNQCRDLICTVLIYSVFMAVAQRICYMEQYVWACMFRNRLNQIQTYEFVDINDSEWPIQHEWCIL